MMNFLKSAIEFEKIITILGIEEGEIEDLEIEATKHRIIFEFYYRRKTFLPAVFIELEFSYKGEAFNTIIFDSFDTDMDGDPLLRTENEFEKLTNKLLAANVITDVEIIFERFENCYSAICK